MRRIMKRIVRKILVLWVALYFLLFLSSCEGIELGEMISSDFRGEESPDAK